MLMILHKRVKIMNKFLLFIVEGRTDERSLGLTLSRLLHHVKFRIVSTDITSDFESNADNIESKIIEQIGYFLAENPQFSFEDIMHVIHLVDTDGAFIDDSRIQTNNSCKDAIYTEDSIFIDDTNKIITRNHRKKDILNHLSKKDFIKGNDKNGISVKLKYTVYYMSCNLEHVLHDKQNCSIEEKIELASSFERKCNDNIHLLRDILFSPSIDNSTNYLDSWEYIKNNNNSLKRKSNFSYFYRQFIDKQ